MQLPASRLATQPAQLLLLRLRVRVCAVHMQLLFGRPTQAIWTEFFLNVERRVDDLGEFVFGH